LINADKFFLKKLFINLDGQIILFNVIYNYFIHRLFRLIHFVIINFIIVIKVFYGIKNNNYN
jgi:hypothetical protein